VPPSRFDKVQLTVTRGFGFILINDEKTMRSAYRKHWGMSEKESKNLTLHDD